MYGKLLKYEFKATWKVSVIIYAALAAITAIGCIYMSLPPVKAINTISEYKPNESLIESISVFMGLFYGISLVAAGAGISIYLIVRFYRNMYTDEGYLMYTLPVNEHELIFSKLLASYIWILGAGLIITASVFILLIAGNNVNIQDVEDIRKAIEAIGGAGTIIYTAGNVLISIFTALLEIYAAISLGQLSSKHRVIMSIVWYVVFYSVIQFVNMFLMLASGYFEAMSGTIDMIRTVYPRLMTGAVVLNLLLAVIYYLITYFVMKKKLNLE